MKHFTIIVGMMAILLVGIAFAAPADITYTVPTPVVSGVPFLIGVNVNAGTIPFTEFDLSFTSSPVGVIFESHSPNYFTVTSSTGAYSGGYRYYTTATEATQTSTGQLFQLQARAFRTGTPPAAYTIGTDVTNPLTITASIGYEALVVSSTSSASFTPDLSVCGDGVVGYVDSNSDGIKQETEVVEACDEGGLNADGSGDNRNVNPGGCAPACNYVELGYSCIRASFSDRNSVCTAMSRKDFFLAKINALFNNQCYPTATHPDKIYEWFCDSDTTNDNPSRATLIAAVGAALTTYLTSPQ